MDGSRLTSSPRLWSNSGLFLVRSLHNKQIPEAHVQRKENYIPPLDGKECQRLCSHVLKPPPHLCLRVPEACLSAWLSLFSPCSDSVFGLLGTEGRKVVRNFSRIAEFLPAPVTRRALQFRGIASCQEPVMSPVSGPALQTKINLGGGSAHRRACVFSTVLSFGISARRPGFWAFFKFDLSFPRLAKQDVCGIESGRRSMRLWQNSPKCSVAMEMRE